MEKFARGFSLFMNWFNGICASVCGIWMALSAVVALPLSWNDFMPVSLLGPLPIPVFMKTSFLWPGIALALVNGLPNVVALVMRLTGRMGIWRFCCVAAGILLICWTVFEMLFIPNGLSAFYLVLGILQLACAVSLVRSDCS